MQNAALHHTFLDRYARLLKTVVRFTLRLIMKGCLCSLLKNLKSVDGSLKNVTYDLHSTDLPNVKLSMKKSLVLKVNLFSA